MIFEITFTLCFCLANCFAMIQHQKQKNLYNELIRDFENNITLR